MSSSKIITDLFQEETSFLAGVFLLFSFQIFLCQSTLQQHRHRIMGSVMALVRNHLAILKKADIFASFRVVVADDDLHKISTSRHFYQHTDSTSSSSSTSTCTTSTLFEQSLDIYRPHVADPKLPVVVLVVGSAWAGHQPIIYRGTSWWNASGPRTFAMTGCTCVCIRHRGGFPRGPSLDIFLGLLVVLFATIYYLLTLKSMVLAIVVTGSFSFLYVLLWWLGRGSATLDDMLMDVATALQWIHQNQEMIMGPHNQLVFGGYSSGGHIAVTVLQQCPHLLQERGIHQEKMIQGVLLLSGVLSVRPFQHGQQRWLTDMLTSSIFGYQVAVSLPSPLESTNHIQLPHLLIGCKQEVPFGLTILDAFFASLQYHEQVTCQNIPSKYVEVDSNHWNILASRALKDVLHRELPLLLITPKKQAT
jgi:acetyl esterase/lipase